MGIRKKHHIVIVIVNMLCLSIASSLWAHTLTASDLMQASAFGVQETSCLRYEIKGVCLWHLVFGKKEKIKTSLYVTHAIPDVVVTVFEQPFENPYELASQLDKGFMTILNPVSQHLIGAPLGDGQMHFNHKSETTIHMKEVDILANPGISLFSQLHEFLLPSVASLSNPLYYSSLLDVLMWRSGLAAVNLASIAQSSIGDWGSLYPKEGTVVGANDYVDAAIVAFRAATLVDEGDASHRSVQTLRYKCKTKKCHASHITPSKNIRWQLVYPTIKSQCTSFGTPSVTKLIANQKGVSADISQGNRAWLMWRQYTGCIPEKGHFIGLIQF